jgi:hypothetical protein
VGVADHQRLADVAGDEAEDDLVAVLGVKKTPCLSPAAGRQMVAQMGWSMVSANWSAWTRMRPSFSGSFTSTTVAR